MIRSMAAPRVVLQASPRVRKLDAAGQWRSGRHELFSPSRLGGWATGGVFRSPGTPRDVQSRGDLGGLRGGNRAASRMLSASNGWGGREAQQSLRRFPVFSLLIRDFRPETSSPAPETSPQQNARYPVGLRTGLWFRVAAETRPLESACTAIHTLLRRVSSKRART